MSFIAAIKEQIMGNDSKGAKQAVETTKKKYGEGYRTELARKGGSSKKRQASTRGFAADTRTAKSAIMKRWTIHKFLKESNAIEGVYDKESLDQALVAWRYLIKEPELSHGVILKTHKLLMLNQPHLQPNERGYYRPHNVRVGSHVAPEWKRVPDLMEAWIAKANQLGDPKADHIEFETIHPFADGNGRIGRMLLNWQQERKGLDIIVLEAAKRQGYYQWFTEARQSSDATNQKKGG